MIENKTGETKSYQDPVGARIEAASTARKRREAKFPPVKSVYDGFYFTFDSTDKRSFDFLAGSEGIIGTELTLVFEGEQTQTLGSKPPPPPKGNLVPTPEDEHLQPPEGDQVQIRAQDGARIATIEGEPARRLLHHHNKGWAIRTALSLTLYHTANKRITGEVACFCYDPELNEAYEQALAIFVDNMIVHRIYSGAHPTLELSQEQFTRVIESKGAWHLTKGQPLPPLEEGMAYYKRRRIWSERLVAAGMQNRLGCNIASIAFWVLFGLAILFAIWWFFLR
ncbi:MAG: hypothetical protein FWG00_05005 [Coriobacteriia bacterium]|nr:hypothetical protein [Coriobacteriia bacterium]